MQPSHIYKSTTEINWEHKGNRYFWTIVPKKTQCGKTSAVDMRVLFLCSFLNTTRVLEMAHPSEIFLGRSTFLRRQIFWLISNQMNSLTMTSTARLAGSESCSKLPSGTASPSTALRKLTNSQFAPWKFLSSASSVQHQLCSPQRCLRQPLLPLH